MAGGKETPRQRLIGLMYLVLLALLALQVSDTIMEKFFFLEQSLEDAKKETEKRNGGALKSIQQKAGERNTADAKAQAATASQVRTETQTILKYINDLKEEIIAATEGRDEEHGGLYKGAKNPITEMMLGPGESKSGKGYALKAKLDAYVKSVNALVPVDKASKKKEVQVPALAQDGNEDPYFKDNSEQRNKDFATLNFDHSTPMVAVMAILAEKANTIASYESLILAKIDPEAVTIKIDKLEPTFSALSSTVAAGMEYEAKIFLSAKNESLKPTVKYGGSNLKIEDDGSAIVKFKASGGSYDKDGLCKKTWEATVGVPGAGGAVTQVPLKGEYFVAKPVIDVKSASVQALYEDCGNELNIQVPSLGANYKPGFTCNAPLSMGAARGGVIVVPKGRGDVTIGVSSGGTFIDKVTFKVRPVPLPDIIAKGVAGTINLKTGISTNSPVINLAAEPDAGFSQFLPKEANYTFGEVVVQVGKGKTARKTVTIQGGTIRLGDFGLQTGDRILIEIKKMYRTNYKGEKIEVALNAAKSVVQIPVN